MIAAVLQDTNRVDIEGDVMVQNEAQGVLVVREDQNCALEIA